jgi:PAS fold
MIAANFHEFRPVFESLPIICAVLARDFRYLAATDAYVKAAQKPRAEFMDKVIYEIFPDNPLNHGAGPSSLKASLERVVEKGKADSMGVIRYDVEQPGGEFMERWWRPVNTPVLDGAGRTLYIIHYVEDINNLIGVLNGAEQAAKARGMTKSLLNQFFS